jgi:hypothetical protein
MAAKFNSGLAAPVRFTEDLTVGISLRAGVTSILVSIEPEFAFVLLTEAGDFLTTESGDVIQVEH